MDESVDNEVRELCWKAQCAFNWSHPEEARRLAGRALDLLATQPSSSRWERSDALHKLHEILGLVDLKNGDRLAAKEHLAASARVDSTPRLASFGPNMVLAEALLGLGEREAVLDYFDACSRIWRLGGSRLAVWAAEVRGGRMPAFGFNACRIRTAGPLCWELRRADVVHGRLYLRAREEAWFVCAFEPSGEFADIEEGVRNDFRERAGESPDLESAYDRLQELQLVLHPGDGGPPVTEAIIQVEGDTAYFRY